MPDMSIIVPIYNAEKYIDRCLTSLLTQTKKELEFILINDGSTDDTEKKILKYKDHRIKYFRNKNQGIGKTRNFGIQKATGKYIMFLDSDDYLEEDACEVLYQKAEQEDLDLVLCDYYQIQNGLSKIEKLPSFKNTTLKKMPTLLKSVNLSPWNKLYKSTLLSKHHIRFIEDLKYEDAPFVVDSLLYAKKVGKVEKPLINYVMHQNSETTIRDERIFDILRIIDLIRKKWKKESYLKEDLDKLTIRMITNYTIQQRNQKDPKIAMKFIDEAFSYMKKEIPDYKKNKYYESRSFLQRNIEKNKGLSKLYCLFYHFFWN